MYAIRITMTKVVLFCEVPFGIEYVETFSSTKDFIDFCEKYNITPDMSRVTDFN